MIFSTSAPAAICPSDRYQCFIYTDTFKRSTVKFLELLLKVKELKPIFFFFYYKKSYAKTANYKAHHTNYAEVRFSPLVSDTHTLSPWGVLPLTKLKLL